MTVALIDRKPSAEAAKGMPGLRLMVLARIACEEGATRGELMREVGALIGSDTASRLPVEAELAQLVRGSLALEHKSRFMASPQGVGLLLGELGLKVLPKTWNELRDIRLVAKARGLETEPASRLKALARPDDLRAEILITTYGLKLKGTASPQKLRAALSLVALERAFGNKIKSELTSSNGFNAKAARVLAGQLLKRPRDAGTDKRLVTLLAAEVAGSAKLDGEAVRAALLRRFAGGGARPQYVYRDVARGRRAQSNEGQANQGQSIQDQVNQEQVNQGQSNRSAVAGAAVAGDASREVERSRGAGYAEAASAVVSEQKTVPQAARPAVASRPDLPGFVRVVKLTAAQLAEGWVGNRKAMISRVFNAIATAHPQWGLSLVEFKAMLAECHRIGHLVLTTADLKDKRQLDELKQSAITYKNTVWHLVRVEE